MNMISGQLRPAITGFSPGGALRDPLGTVRLITALEAEARELGVEPVVSSDFADLARLRLELRGKPVSPMFDPQASGLDPTRGFWMAGRSLADGRIVSLNAFRIDHVEPDLAHWALGWMVGLYMRRKELILPAHMDPPPGSRARHVSGRCVYHGEMWNDAKVLRQRGAVEILPLIGMLLAHLKWQPDAFWGVVSQAMATRGVATKTGYAHLERSFLRWEWTPDGAEPIEWLALIERDDIEFLIAERLEAR